MSASYTKLPQQPPSEPYDYSNSRGDDTHLEGTSPKRSGSGSLSGDIVQFMSPIFIVDTSEGKIECDIMRIGDLNGSVSFNYYTIACSAIEGTHFLPASGRLEMGPGQDRTLFEVDIVDDPRWYPTTEFMVCLSDPEGCVLGLYLKTARVKVMDTTVFPSDTFKEHVRKGKIDSISRFTLLAAFYHMCYQVDSVRWKTFVTLVLDQLSNFYLYLRLILSVYMVDTVFNMNKSTGELNLIFPDDRLRTSYFVACVIFFPMLLLHAVEVLKIKMDIKGMLRRELCRGLFRKFMNYNAESRHDVARADMVLALTSEAHDVTFNYCRTLELARLAGKLGVFIYFTLQHNPDCWWTMVMVPSVMAIWGCCRVEKFVYASDASESAEAENLTLISEMLSKLGLIAEYAQRPQINDMFAEKSEKLRQVKIPEALVNHNNNALPKLLGPLLVAVYTAIGANLVFTGHVKLGVYLATISVFTDVCDSFSECFGQLMDIVSRSAALTRITILLNKPIDVPNWKAVARARKEKTKEMESEIMASRKDGTFKGDTHATVADLLPIQFTDMCFAHPGAPDNLQNVNISAPQGCICSVRGWHGHSRKTFLQLLAHKIFPTSGMVFVPSHLRILYVSKDPVLLSLSLWQNLTFGNYRGNIVNPFRVENILKELNMEKVLALCAADLDQRKRSFQPNVSETGEVDAERSDQKQIEHVRKENPLEKLTSSQIALIHLARAFIMNPEVMVLHRPFMHYHKVPGVRGSCEVVKDAIIKHRSTRGLAMPQASVHLRRPRTVFFTPEDEADDEIADHIWTMPPAVGGNFEEESCRKQGETGARRLSYNDDVAKSARESSNEAITRPVVARARWKI